MLKKMTIALGAGLAAWTGGVASGVTTVSNAYGSVSLTASMTEWPWLSDSYHESFHFINNPGVGIMQTTSWLSGPGGWANCKLQWFVDYPLAAPEYWSNYISASGSANYGGAGASASSSFFASFSVDRDGMFSFATTGNGSISLTGTVSYGVSGGESLSGFLPAGNYVLAADASQGSFDLRIPSVGSLTTAGFGLALIAVRRRRS